MATDVYENDLIFEDDIALKPFLRCKSGKHRL